MRIVQIIVVVLLFVVAALAGFLYKGDLPKEMVDTKYTNNASRFLVMPNGARVHYRDEGNPGGQPLVLIHGSNASLHTWEPWVTILGNQYRIISMDLPGHGLTGRVPDDDYSSAAFIRTVDAVVDEVGAEQFVLGGNSMGGGVTWQYTLAHPDRVQALLLIDASGLPAWWQDRAATAASADGEEREAPLAFQLLGQPWFRTIARYLDPHMLVVQGLKSAYNNSPVVNDALVTRYYELALREGTRDATMKRFGGFNRGGGAEYNLASISQPTLIMWGAQDALIPVKTAERFHAAITNSTVVIYEDLGHIPMEEAPARSAADVARFLAQAGLSGATVDNSVEVMAEQAIPTETAQ